MESFISQIGRSRKNRIVDIMLIVSKIVVISDFLCEILFVIVRNIFGMFLKLR